MARKLACYSCSTKHMFLFLFSKPSRSFAPFVSRPNLSMLRAVACLAVVILHLGTFSTCHTHVI
jgi:hypothetical protein